MKKNFSVLMSVTLACILLVGCSADNTSQNRQESEPVTQAQTGQMEAGENVDDEISEGTAEASKEVAGESAEETSKEDAGEDVTEVSKEVGSEEAAEASEEVVGEDATEASKEADGESATEVSNGETDVVESDIDPLYEAFLKNEISVSNPYAEGMDLTVMDDEKYESEFQDAQKSYALVDVNVDDQPELIFRISAYPSELMYILGICENELICFDVMETHTKDMAFGVYDYGFVWKIHNYDDFEMTLYAYTADGQQNVVRHFTKEDEADIAAHEGEEPEWIALVTE